MISREEGRDIAGQKLIERYGREYLIKNIQKLSLNENLTEGTLKVTFTFHPCMDEINIVKEEGLVIDEQYMPEVLLIVKINLRTGETEIVTN